jgi:hypothetical protein
MMEMSERCLLRLTRMSNLSKYKEDEPRAGQGMFKDPQENPTVMHFWGDQTL